MAVSSSFFFFLILAHPFFSGKKKRSTKRDRPEKGKCAVEEGKRHVLYCPYTMQEKTLSEMENGRNI